MPTAETVGSWTRPSASCQVEMVRRQARLFALTEYLRGRRTGVTAETLADRFGVTVRTIYRDLDTLRDASLPVQADRGRGGGYALDRNYTLPPVNFTAREAALLLAVGSWASSMRLVPFTETLSAGLDKVRGALTASAQRELVEHMGALRFIGVPAPPVSAPIRRAIERAWFERLPVRIEYRHKNFERWSGELFVRGVIMERSMVLLECDALDGGPRRHVRLDHVERASLLPRKTDPA
jgi:predicted DNA-binding transcriptional regulator YafY